jgi:hypothetical protein
MYNQIGRMILWFFLGAWLVGCQAPPTPAPAITATVPPSPTAASATATPTAAAPAVESLNTESADTVIRLSWQAVSGARGYFIYRDGNSNPLNPTSIADTRFEDIGLTNGRTYTYTVAAMNQDGQTGPRSAPIQAAPKSR